MLFVNLLAPPFLCLFAVLTKMYALKGGVMAIFKPKSMSSTVAVSKIRRCLERKLKEPKGEKVKVKVGHGGTLDPLAEGVLVIGVGSGTKMMGNYLSGSKVYRAEALLGVETDTLDCTGNITETVDASHVTLDQLRDALSSFRGTIQQVPPMYSALKKNGTRLYDLARKGVVIEREARTVVVDRVELVTTADSISRSIPQLPNFCLDIESGGGFYVRSLISDLAKVCGTRGHMTKLLRSKQGMFTIDDCLHSADWNYDSICEHLEKSNEFLAKLSSGQT